MRGFGFYDDFWWEIMEMFGIFEYFAIIGKFLE